MRYLHQLYHWCSRVRVLYKEKQVMELLTEFLQPTDPMHYDPHLGVHFIAEVDLRHGQLLPARPLFAAAPPVIAYKRGKFGSTGEAFFLEFVCQ
jgi:hypothetical protein